MAVEQKEYRVCEGGAYIQGLFSPGGSSIKLNTKQAKYLLMDHTVDDPSRNVPAAPPPPPAATFKTKVKK